jgi:hypothetical protein
MHRALSPALDALCAGGGSAGQKTVVATFPARMEYFAIPAAQLLM